jgi:hypothetical protein
MNNEEFKTSNQSETSMKTKMILADNDEEGFYDAIETLQNQSFVLSTSARMSVKVGALDN